MNTEVQLPVPILFNCIKHHTIFIQDKIQFTKYKIEELRNKLVVIGDSQMDLYYGDLSPQEIGNEIIELLKKKKVFEQDQYNLWLNENGSDYRTVTLSDTSIWTLRLSDDKQRYVHIHPGRYSPQTVRVKATTLKTALAVLVYAKKLIKNPFDLELINKVRSEILDESPIKSLEGSKSLIRIINLLEKEN